MTKIKNITLSLVMCGLMVIPIWGNEKSLEDIKLYPSGEIVYVQGIFTNNMVVEVLDKASKLKKNDVILSVISRDGKEINCNNEEEMINLFKREKEPIKVIYKRDGEIKKENMTSDDLREVLITNGSGYFGTITAIDQDGNFVGLAHNVSLNPKNDLQFKSSRVYRTSYVKTKKGRILRPGNIVTSPVNEKIGDIYSYGPYGVKGQLDKNYSLENLKPMSIAIPKEGKAYIYCKSPITNELQMHEIEILEVEERISKIKVLDNDLIQYRGGIVRGMSGSPVIQDGKIIGGVRSVSRLNNKIGHISNIDWMLK